MSAAADEAFPLSWPAGWPRARRSQRSRFGQNSLYKSRAFLQHELRLLGATSVVLSTNIPLRLDGLPYSGSKEPADHGVAVYFRLKGEPRVLACDKWDRVADNMTALAKHIEAVRGQVRWGVGSLEQAFGGYKALPEMGARKQWWEVLALKPDAGIDEVERKRQELLMRHHPDRGGSHALAAEINAAVDEARRAQGAAL